MSLKTIKGPGIFLAQFAADEAPFNNLPAITNWVGSLGYKGVQLPIWDKRLFDVQLAAASKDYCDELRGVCEENGVQIVELASHLIGQLVATHPSHNRILDAFAPDVTRLNEPARREWAIGQMQYAAMASKNLGLDRSVTFSGNLLWPFLYPHPAYPPNFVHDAFKELAKRWRPLLDFYQDHGVAICYELHPMEDLHDGVTFEQFLEQVGGHPACNIMYDPSHFVLQCMDYLGFIDVYHERIKMFHVKDAEYRFNARSGVYGGYQPWLKRAGRFRSLGDGQVDFKSVFSKLTEYGFDGWAVLEWECCLKNHVDGAREGSSFIAEHIINAVTRSFDDFVATDGDQRLNQVLLGLGNQVH